MSEEAQDVVTLDSGHFVITDELCCPICGDEYEVGDQVVDVPVPSGLLNHVETVHYACAVRTGEIKVTQVRRDEA